MNIREINASDFNLVSVILKDLIDTFGEIKLDTVFVIEEKDRKIITVMYSNVIIFYDFEWKNNTYVSHKHYIAYNKDDINIFEDELRKVVYDNNDVSLLHKKEDYSEYLGIVRTDYYNYNTAIMYGYRDLKADNDVQQGYGTNIYSDEKRPYLNANFMSACYDVIYSQHNRTKYHARYATSEYHFIGFWLNMLKQYGTDFINNYQLYEDRGIYITSLLGNKPIFGGTSRIPDYKEISKEVLNVYNNSDEEINYYQKLADESKNYEELRKDKAYILLKEN